MAHARSRPRVLALTAALAGLLLLAAVPGQAAPSSPWKALKRSAGVQRISERELASARLQNEGEGESEAMAAAEAFSLPRSLPAGTVSAGALRSAWAQGQRMNVVGGPWTEVQTVPYDTDNPDYRDPYISNSGAGSGFAAGRTQAVAIDGSTVYAGGADGGVWKSTDGGDTWTPIFDDKPSLSIGDVQVNTADHAVWVGTGEAATSADGFLGMGVYRSGDGGATWRRVGGSQLESTLISKLAFDRRGQVYAATSAGVFRHSSTGHWADAWELVLKAGEGPYGLTFTNEVAVQPHTRGRVVIANQAWRGGNYGYNGFYVSTKGGDPGTWRKVRTDGIPMRDIGRASFAYSSDGTWLWALVESLRNYNYHPETALMGVYVSKSGDPAGPWVQKADYATLTLSPGSALNLGEGYAAGIQAWYNQFIGVDPSDRGHVYVGLEEVYETGNAGHNWRTIGPYWNFGLPCASDSLDDCPPTTHPDQHGIAFDGTQVWVANDGGVYSRPIDGSGGWSNHNENLRMLQYYYGGTGDTPDGVAYWGGLQDNGSSLLLPTGSMVSPFGGDGGDVIVDANDAMRTVQEYVYLDMWLTTNGGQSDGSTFAWREISPSCYAFTYTPDPCEPNPRFIAPFRADVNDPDNHWVAGGQYVWETTQGWDTQCDGSSCDWAIVHDTGSGNTTTALAVNGGTIYAGWCGAGCNPSPYFATGIDTNYGGTWHTVAGPSVSYTGDALPQRYVMNLAVDPADDGHIYAVYGAYSRRWIEGGGVGHVFESADGGDTWTDISGDLPDAPATDQVMTPDGQLVVSTDAGVFITDAADPGAWSRLGTGLPGAIPADLTTTPDGGAIVAVTHGRGMWRIPMPGA